METLLTGLSTFALGFGTVFVGLICLILIIKLMSVVLAKPAKDKQVAPASRQESAPVVSAPAMENRGQFIASPDARNSMEEMAAAAIAATMGTDVTGIRILSVKKVNQ